MYVEGVPTHVPLSVDQRRVDVIATVAQRLQFSRHCVIVSAFEVLLEPDQRFGGALVCER